MSNSKKPQPESASNELVPINQNARTSQPFDISNAEDTRYLAADLSKFILENKLFHDIQGKNYVNVEGWQYAGTRLGILPKVEDLSRLPSAVPTEIRYQAKVELIDLRNGHIVGSGYAICSNGEPSKKYYQEYAIASMAQTRAVGKAYRTILSWIIKAAGYEPTPAEEMKTEDDIIFDKLAAIVTVTKAESRDQLVKAYKEHIAFKGDADFDRAMKIMSKLYPKPAEVATEPTQQAVTQQPSVDEELNSALAVCQQLTEEYWLTSFWLKSKAFHANETFTKAFTIAKERIKASEPDATQEQKEHLSLLLKEPQIQAEERQKMTDKIENGMKNSTILKAIEKVKKVIEERKATIKNAA
jgi:hypothetical protein